MKLINDEFVLAQLFNVWCNIWWLKKKSLFTPDSDLDRQNEQDSLLLAICSLQANMILVYSNYVVNPHPGNLKHIWRIYLLILDNCSYIENWEQCVQNQNREISTRTVCLAGARLKGQKSKTV